MRFLILLLLSISLFAVDFDVIVVGSSPFSLFEALYQSHSGKRVLILEESEICGGAWKSIPMCGVPNADLGCHQIGADMNLKAFLEEYAGCKLVSLDNPLLPFEQGKSPNGFYFSKGCFELIDHLLKLIEVTDIVLLTNTKMENVSVDPPQQIATVQTKNRSYTTSKLIVTPMSCFCLQPNVAQQNYGKSKYHHLYLLVQDPTPPRFSYHSGIGNGVSRVMNLSHFVGLTGTGQHLLVIQVHNEQFLANGTSFLEVLKTQKLLDPSAYILRSESYIYEAGSFHQGLITQMHAQSLIDVLQTGHFQNLSTYIPKWKMVLKPYNQIISE